MSTITTAVETTVPHDFSSPVPFVDLDLQNQRVRTAIQEGISAVLDTNAFVLGPQVQAFEEQYAKFCDIGHCVGVGNGTDAIELALRAADIGHGHEVIIPANTFVATAEAVVRTGATLVLADCGPDFLIDPAKVADRVTPRTRAVIGVDLYGQIADFRGLREAVGDEVLLFEDAAQSQGAKHWGQPAGSFGVAAATSFYPGKNLGAYGDGGAVTTASLDIADRVRAMRNHGGIRRYQHDFLGTNSRLDSIQAAVLSVKLAELDTWNAERVSAASLYRRMLSDTEQLVLPEEASGNEHVWHLYVVRVARREHLLQRMEDAGIGTGVHYPAPVHHLKAFRALFPDGEEHPMAELMAQEIVSLPMFPGITEDQQQRVVAALKEAVNS